MVIFIYLNILHVINVHVIELNACKSSPCENRGRCEDTAQGFQCKCKDNFVGVTCARMYYAIIVMYSTISVTIYTIAHSYIYLTSTSIHFR